MNKPTKIPATAYILIGGESKRFGSLKWQTTINGQTILDRIWDACDGIGNRCVIGKKKPDSISYPFIKDQLEINAPINGLYTALKYSKTEWILLLSCDLPLIDSRLLENLWESKNENCNAVIPIANDKMQVTCGFYHNRVLSTLEPEIEKKNYSIFKLLKKLNSYYINFGNNESFLNMNTKKDLRAVEKILISKTSL
jgi:molybdopterin-guanine dinucleotide biosynthesis protein A